MTYRDYDNDCDSSIDSYDDTTTNPHMGVMDEGATASIVCTGSCILAAFVKGCPKGLGDTLDRVSDAVASVENLRLQSAHKSTNCHARRCSCCAELAVTTIYGMTLMLESIGCEINIDDPRIAEQPEAQMANEVGNHSGDTEDDCKAERPLLGGIVSNNATLKFVRQIQVEKQICSLVTCVNDTANDLDKLMKLASLGDCDAETNTLSAMTLVLKLVKLAICERFVLTLIDDTLCSIRIDGIDDEKLDPSLEPLATAFDKAIREHNYIMDLRYGCLSLFERCLHTLICKVPISRKAKIGAGTIRECMSMCKLQRLAMQVHATVTGKLGRGVHCDELATLVMAATSDEGSVPMLKLLIHNVVACVNKLVSTEEGKCVTQRKSQV